MSRDDDRTLPPDPSDIAVIGIACRFPGADGPDAFWRNLREGVESVSFFSDEELQAAGIPESVYRAPNYVRAHAVVKDVELFDAGFFGYSPREAEVMDPQQRLFLECSWQALESAGYDASRVSGGGGREGAVVGVWGGVTLSSYLLALNPLQERLRSIGVDTTMLAVGNDKDSLAPRVAYKLDLRGPAITVQTACSTSLVAVHMACQSLLAGETDMALAGAVSLTLPMNSGYLYQEGGILSPDGHCRSFDERAAGTVFGCGAGVVVLKRLAEALADGDTIHAVIRGTAVNNDGAGKVGFTAPSVAGQAEVIAEALANAGLSPDDISYVEAHGTATALGDPVEIAALSKAFRSFPGAGGGTTRRGYCALGTVKTNLGHLEAAAGMAGLIKTILALRHGEIPPTLHFARPNPQIDFAGSPFFVNTELAPWPAGNIGDTGDTDGNPRSRRAGVSSFGFGGTNAHVVLEEPPPSTPTDPDRPWHLLVLSARSAGALGAATGNLAEFLDQNPGIDTADVAYTLETGRRAFEHRRAVACRNALDGRDALGDPTRASTGVYDGRERQVAFLFPGQGAQHPGMARGIYAHEPVFRAEIDRCAELFQAHLGPGFDLRRFLTAAGPETAQEAELLERTENAQPALFAVCYALARLWQSWGIRPKAMLGNSLGEYVAACLAGVFSLEDAVALVAERGRLMRELPGGDMLAIALPESELLPLLATEPELSLAAIHGPEMCIVSGTPAAAARLQERLLERGIECPQLHTSHAFHSPMMDPVVAPFEAFVRGVRLSPPRIPFVSNVTGRFITPAEATDPAYWSRHLRQTVRLGDGLGTLLGRPGMAFLEVGPAQALSGAARQHPARTPAHAVQASLPHPKDTREDVDTLLSALGGLWVAGVEIDWTAVHAGRRRRRVPLPTYPFERQRYWIDFEKLAGTSAATSAGVVTAETTVPLALQAAPPARPASPAKTPTATGGGSYVANRYATDGESSSYVAPRNEIEEILADLWQTLLGVERVGVEDNFFRLNGNSLIVLQALSRIQAVFGVKLKVRSFFETPTVAGLSAIIALRQPGLEALAEKARILEEVQGLSARAVEAELTLPAPPVIPAGPVVAAGVGDGGDERALRFSLFFFSGNESMFPEYKYKLIVEAAKFADQNGFTAIWTPERHFHSFGGLYPNPSVLAAALAMVTERLSLRAGSVVLPLHNPIRVAEEWSVVDNLSRGRAGLSFASGFHPNDFTFAPESYARRRDEMFEKIATLRRLWHGERVRVPGGAGNEIEVEIFPKPVQREVPLWITCANNPQTFEQTGEIGANVLTSLIGLTTDALAERIALYRTSRARHGHDPETGQVAVMLHTFVGTDLEIVKEKVRGPFCNYLRSHTELLTSLARSLHQSFDDQSFAKEDLEELLQMEFERYFASGSLLGTPESCRAMVQRLREIGVDELGCLLDFGVDVPSIMASLEHLNELRRLSAREVVIAG
ncbi:MAG TPA: MupA/Atu3671 family FMN-dependent luciferase-like monooxygenase [Thermoanaerobaculia bacterium]|nr:MupA/Atu3671 family FMN-dependent luciferase-like monooxygenase [Thermoanaerobaculia bacterium]